MPHSVEDDLRDRACPVVVMHSPDPAKTLHGQEPRYGDVLLEVYAWLAERVVALESNSWYPPGFAEAWQGTGPWFRLFQSARKWCGA